jgi:hypothetical protein
MGGSPHIIITFSILICMVITSRGMRVIGATVSQRAMETLDQGDRRVGERGEERRG